MSGFLDRLSHARSLLITAPLIFIYTGIMGSISVLSSFFDSTGRIQHACSRVWARMILRTCGVTVKVTGSANLSSNIPYVLCVNHQSHMDIPVVLAALPFQFRFAAKKELFRIPFLGWHLRRSGHVPIDRVNPRAAVKSIRDAATKIREGSPIVIFPEGGTSQDGAIKPFKGGGFMLASQSMVDAVPVTIRGSREVLMPQTYHVRRGFVEVSIGKPIPSQGMAPAELAKIVRQEIVSRFENGKTMDRHSYTFSS
jgi:1-acyl-sn-glycerol-3-phosphate acyltransferase